MISIYLIFTQGPKDANNSKIVNNALIYFVQNYKMNKVAQGFD